jgi:hypothetical protein
MLSVCLFVPLMNFGMPEPAIKKFGMYVVTCMSDYRRDLDW